jgi:hypothetical protein
MGFRVEKRGGALCLYWQRGELVSVSAWRRAVPLLIAFSRL